MAYNIEEVIELLESKDITKKEACEHLGLLTAGGNPQYKKLTESIDRHKAKQKASAKLRKRKRSEAFTDAELANIVGEYLAGESLAQLSETYFRSVNLIKQRLERAGALLRRPHVPKTDPWVDVDEYTNPVELPEQCVKESFSEGEHVWSTRYGQVVKVVKEYKPGIYRVFMSNDAMRQYAYQDVSDLGSLQHLLDLGVKFKLVSNDF